MDSSTPAADPDDSRFAPHGAAASAIARVTALGADIKQAGYAPVGRPAPAEEEVELVYFHAGASMRGGDSVPAGEGISQLAHAVQAAALRAPRSPRVLITGVETRIPEGIALHHVIRANIDPGRLAYERLRLQHTLLTQRPRRTATVFLDGQALANRAPASAFARAFDVGLTCETGPDGIPVHAGVVYAAAGNRAERYYRRALDAFDTIADDPVIAAGFDTPLRAASGDRLALWLAAGARLPGRDAPERLAPEGVTLDDLRIALLPCAQYSFGVLRGVPYRSADMAPRYFIRFDMDSLAAQARYVEMMGRGLV